jgi:hypothetical protein
MESPFPFELVNLLGFLGLLLLRIVDPRFKRPAAR